MKENVEYSQSTANNLMQIHTEYSANSQVLGNLSYTKAVALLGIDAEEREAFVQENNVEELSSRELQKVIKEKQKLEKQIAQQEADATKEKSLLEKDIQDLEQQLEDAREQSSDNEVSEKEINRLTQELAVAESRAKQLEENLKAKPIEAATVEIVPESVQKELDQLRSKMNEATDPAEVKFKIQFESLVNEFNSTLEVLSEIGDSVTQSKYTNAIHKLMDKMRATLEGE
ncbi:putative nucleic acid-binding Zn-ribbon protein [Lysinibacillus parviboronicapiens]|uniref:Nucleic acid-binding Zn-ribbon protein n=1 Tax=Lysinibacillus parviboronicapiens TaxID=436516 RepID=A0ABV2PQ78_9BACI